MRRFLLFTLTTSVLLTFLSGCSIRPANFRTPAQLTNHSIEEGITSDADIDRLSHEAVVPASVKNLLFPTVSDKKNNFANAYNRRYNINVNNIEAATFFKNLAKETPYNIVVDPKVTGTISINLKNVTLTEILNSIKDIYGYEYKPTNFGFEVMPAKLETRVFHVDYLDIVRNTRSFTNMGANEISSSNSVTSGDVTNNGLGTPQALPGQPGLPGSSTTTSSTGSSRSVVNTTSTLDFWNELTTTLKAFVGTEQGHSVVVNPSSGTIIIKAYPNEIREISAYLEKIQSNMSREVILEVKLLEVTLNDAYQSGINWSVFGFTTPNSAIPATAASTTPPYTQINIHGNNFATIIQLLQEQGNVQILSNPRVLSINNQQALIKIGQEKYFVTGITTNVNNSTGTNSITTASVNLTPFFSGIILDITPQISAGNEVLLHIHPVISQVTTDNQSINIGSGTDMVLPLADNSVREYDSIVRCRDNELILIGGLMQNNMTETVNGTPGVSKVPFLGSLFRVTNQTASKSEIVILLKPTIVGRDQQTMSQQLPVTQERIAELDRGFHAGSLPNIFGNTAEDPNDPNF